MVVRFFAIDAYRTQVIVNRPDISPQECLVTSLASYLEGRSFWAHKDLNLGPTDYESVALTN